MQEFTKEEVLQKLGLDKMPEARMKGLEQREIPSGGGMLKWKKACQLLDAIESAAFMRYCPDGIVVDQSLDPTSFDPSHSRIISIPTDRPAPVNPKITRATGISANNTAQDQYLYLWTEVVRYVMELGASAISPIRVFRTSGAEGTVPLLGAVFKLDYKIPDGLTREDIGSNLGWLSDKKNNAVLDESAPVA